ncbi:DUF1566 domain-containing protein [Sorangium cellulosum]|uniref:Lcl C-terminal domain-containing protein n=1 Tax=Sorangium cellulosum TaxID=56 RepID=UPI001E44D1DA|nr:DUF1566 domain-containing protein [Sorangium cellulosum]
MDDRLLARILSWRRRLPMPNETPHALRFTWLLAALLVESVTLAGCIGEPFQLGSSSGGGEPIGGGGSEPIGGGGSEPIGGGGGEGGTGGGGSPPVPVTWPDSPTTRCSNGTTVLEACPGPSAPFFGQDGNYQIAVPSYTEADGAVEDSVTGLTWEKVVENGAFTLVGAQEHCAALSAQGIGGLSDWRLPTRIELVSILDFGHATAFPDIFFTSTQDSFYWSATDVAADSSFAWGVLASDASLGFFSKDDTAGARALCVGGVKGIAPADLSPGEDWVLDRSTGLVWQRHASQTRFIWSDALAHCEDLDLAAKSDWRLPSAKELLSIVDDRRSGPAIDLEAFPGTPSDVFWSSTPAIGSAEKAVLVNFTNGASQGHTVRDRRLVRCVRSDG